MKPLILEFVESAEPGLNYLPLIEYDQELNLSVIKGTKIPAYLAHSMGTDTGTRTRQEGNDQDKSIATVAEMLGTDTFTKASHEGPDSDRASVTIYDN